MIRVNVREAKARFSTYLKMVENGDTVVVCRRNQPIAEIRKVADERLAGPREMGLAAAEHGPWQLPSTFFEHLPKPLLDALGRPAT